MKKTYIFPLFLIFVTVLALCAFVLSRQNNFGADEYRNDICELSNLNDELNETDYRDSSETTNAKSLLNNADLITKEGKKLLKDFKDIFDCQTEINNISDTSNETERLKKLDSKFNRLQKKTDKDAKKFYDAAKKANVPENELEKLSGIV